MDKGEVWRERRGCQRVYRIRCAHIKHAHAACVCVCVCVCACAVCPFYLWLMSRHKSAHHTHIHIAIRSATAQRRTVMMLLIHHRCITATQTVFSPSWMSNASCGAAVVRLKRACNACVTAMLISAQHKHHTHTLKTLARCKSGRPADTRKTLRILLRAARAE